MPGETVCSYELRHRRRNRELINKTTVVLHTLALCSVCFTKTCISLYHFYVSSCCFAFWQSLINEYMITWWYNGSHPADKNTERFRCVWFCNLQLSAARHPHNRLAPLVQTSAKIAFISRSSLHHSSEKVVLTIVLSFFYLFSVLCTSEMLVCLSAEYWYTNFCNAMQRIVIHNNDTCRPNIG